MKNLGNECRPFPIAAIQDLGYNPFAIRSALLRKTTADLIANGTILQMKIGCSCLQLYQLNLNTFEIIVRLTGHHARKRRIFRMARDLEAL